MIVLHGGELTSLQLGLKKQLSSIFQVLCFVNCEIVTALKGIGVCFMIAGSTRVQKYCEEREPKRPVYKITIDITCF